MGVTRFPVSPTLLWWHYLYARSVSVCDAILRYRVIQVKRHSSHPSPTSYPTVTTQSTNPESDPNHPRFPPPSNQTRTPLRAHAHAHARSPARTKQTNSPAPRQPSRDCGNQNIVIWLRDCGESTHILCAYPTGADGFLTEPTARSPFHSTHPTTFTQADIVAVSSSSLQIEQSTFTRTMLPARFPRPRSSGRA